MKKKYFSEGDEVVHKDNVSLKMIVKQIIVYKKKITVFGKKEKEEKTFISGIRCGWWKDDEFIYGDFHSRHLVPWDIAKQGQDKIIEWLQQN